MSGVKPLLLTLVATLNLWAHIGSPDVFFQGKAGPYPVLVAIRPPDVIPGVARIEVRTTSSDVREIQLTPTPMTGPAATHPPVADVAERSKADPQLFEGSLWLMTPGSWQVHVRATGDQGSGELPVPVPAVALRMKPMQKGVSYFLFGMMVFLTVGGVAIVGAGVRDADATQWNRKTIVAMACASAVIIAGLWGGAVWWGADDTTNRAKIYKPLQMTGSLVGSDGLGLHLSDPGWLPLRRLDDLVRDHDHLMHLFLVRWPAMDRVYHLHPDQVGTGFFETALPEVSAGSYRMFGDIVHDNGLAETAVGEIQLPDIAGKPLAKDDAAGPSVPDGVYRMVWLRDESKPIAATALNLFSFEIFGPEGIASTLQPYMGMGGHAEFIKTDASVFAHVHPSGSVPMASVAIASQDAMLAMHETNPGPVVSFPYGVPSPGTYKIFVQMKHDGRVDTGAFEFTAIAPQH